MSTPTPPDWVLNTQTVAPMHNQPAPSYEWQQMSADQQKVLWNKLLESVWQQFMLWVQGILLPGPAGVQIMDWATAFINDITTIINGIVNFLGGNSGSWVSGDVGQPLLDTATILASLSAQINALKQSTAGQSVVVDFSTYPNSTNLPTIFTESYAGSGTNPLGVTDGRVKIGGGNFLARSASGLYNVFVTDGDDQVISAVWTGRPVNDGFGNRGHFILDGRVDASDQDTVFADFAEDSVTLGCWVSSVKTQFVTLGNGGSGIFSFKAGAIYELSLTGRVYVLKENTAAILTYNDSGLVASLGASYRGGGLAAQWPFSAFGNVNPGELLYWAFADQ